MFPVSIQSYNGQSGHFSATIYRKQSITPDPYVHVVPRYTRVRPCSPSTMRNASDAELLRPITSRGVWWPAL